MTIEYTPARQASFIKAALRYWETVLADAENEMAVNGQLHQTTRISLRPLSKNVSDEAIVEDARKEVGKFKAEVVRLRLLS